MKNIHDWNEEYGLYHKNRINKIKLSNDAKEILDIALLTNSYFPRKNITEKEFLNYKEEEFTPITKNSLIYNTEEFLHTNIFSVNYYNLKDLVKDVKDEKGEIHRITCAPDAGLLVIRNGIKLFNVDLSMGPFVGAQEIHDRGLFVGCHSKLLDDDAIAHLVRIILDEIQKLS